MYLSLTTAPAVEPLSLTEAKNHARVDIGDDDDLLTDEIQAAREWVETYTRRQLITATWTLHLSGWSNTIRLPRPPLQSVESIKYRDVDGVEQTLSTDVYEVHTDCLPGEVRLAYGQTWPGVRDSHPDAIEIEFVAGYGDASSSVPQPIRSAMRILLTDLYEHRESLVVGTVSSNLRTVERLLWPYRYLEA